MLRIATIIISAWLAGLIVATPSQASQAAEYSDLFRRDSAFASGCSNDGAVQASCQNTSVVSNTCCFETPGGLLLQTQLWDTNPSAGPPNSWTIHGLWPDKCDETMTENCDPSRDYTNIAGLLNDQGASDTRSYMETFWVDTNGNNEAFWENEWAVHGTCMSTLEPSCLPSGSQRGAEAVAFFQTVVGLFKTLPTYEWLSSAGILPSDTATYSLSDIISALETGSGGFTPVVGCVSDSLNTISWYFNLRGSVVDGTFVPINAPAGEASTLCPSSGVKYPPKSS